MRTPILIVALAVFSGAPSAQPTTGGVITGKVVVVRGKQLGDQSHTWVYLKQIARHAKAAAPVSTDIVQIRQAFVPNVRVVPVGSKIAFPNKDVGKEHNVFSNDAGFDLGVFIGGDSKTRTFDVPGEFKIYCDKHVDMVATVKVVESPPEWMIAEVKNGAFTFANVPPGRYRVVGWRPNVDDKHLSISEEVTVTDGGSVTVGELHVQEYPDPPHLRKNQTHYPPYP